MFSKRILFTYESPFINNRIDITEYDRVCIGDCFLLQSRLSEGIMLNDSIMNFYMNYSLTEFIEGQLSLLGIPKEDAVLLLQKKHLADPSREELIKGALNSLLLTFHIFSTFLYPQLSKLRCLDNRDIKKKLLKWCENAAVFQRQCVFFPIFQK